MSTTRTARLIASLACALTAAALPLGAQVITPKTVPIHQGAQFDIYPSQWPGMGGVGIALHDTLGDLWSNPAKAMRLRVGSITVMPFTHTATAGGGRSIPVSLLQTGGNMAGGALYSLQEVERRDTWWNVPISDRRASNTYYSGVLARRIGEGLSVGAGISYADLRGVDGVGALYAGSDRVRQTGSQLDARLGLVRDFANGATLELVGVGYRYRMSHDVHYAESWIWPPCLDCMPGRPCPPCEPIRTPGRSELNLDRTNATGLHAVYLPRPTEGGWRIGYLVTANRLSHPKIPNYQIQNIPRDPGNTNALNLGFGMARTLGDATFGLDVVLEPMWSHTWADGARDTLDVDGALIRRGQHTVDNHFRFNNSRINIGFAHQAAPANDSSISVGIQVGVSLRSIRYTLDQTNHVLKTSRTQDEAWGEWTPTVALRLKGREMEVSYSISYTCGPTCFEAQRTFVAEAAPADPGVIAAPSGPLTFDGGSASRHRLMVSLRLR